MYGQWRSKLEPSCAPLSMLLTLSLFAKGVSCPFVLWLFPAIFPTHKPTRAFAICALFVVIANVKIIGMPELFVSTYWIAISARQALFAWLLVDTLRTNSATADPS